MLIFKNQPCKGVHLCSTSGRFAPAREGPINSIWQEALGDFSLGPSGPGLRGRRGIRARGGKTRPTECFSKGKCDKELRRERMGKGKQLGRSTEDPQTPSRISSRRLPEQETPETNSSSQRQNTWLAQGTRTKFSQGSRVFRLPACNPAGLAVIKTRERYCNRPEKALRPRALLGVSDSSKSSSSSSSATVDSAPKESPQSGERPLLPEGRLVP